MENIEHKIGNERSSLKGWAINFLAHEIVWRLIKGLLKGGIIVCYSPLQRIGSNGEIKLKWGYGNDSIYK